MKFAEFEEIAFFQQTDTTSSMAGCLVKGHDGLPPVDDVSMCKFAEGGQCTAIRIREIRKAIQASLIDSQEYIPDPTEYFPMGTTVGGLVERLISLTKPGFARPERKGPSHMNQCPAKLTDSQAEALIASSN